jgi:transketolase
MTKRITADHVKLKRAYEPATANDGTRILIDAYARTDLTKAFQQAIQDELPDGWDGNIPGFLADEEDMATRVAAGKVMNAVGRRLPGLIGGAADLNPSLHTVLSGLGGFEHAGVTVRDKQGAVEVWSYISLNLYFGVREHDMGRS